MVRRSLVLVFIAMLIALVLWTGYVKGILRLPGQGDSLIERWCADQLRLMANDLLVPEVRFRELRYIAPDVIELHDVSIIAEGDVNIIEAAVLRLQLGRFPRRGEPLVIQSISFESPVVRLHLDEEESLIGFANFVRSAEGEVRSDGGSTRPSEVFAVRHLAIIDGTLEYRDGTGRTMQWPDVDFELQCEPETDRAGYAIEAFVDHAPVLELSLSGRFDLDELTLELQPFLMHVDLAPERYERLPPGVQEFVAAHEIRGRLEVAVRGMIPFNSIVETSLRSEVSLSEAYATFGIRMYPVQSLTASITHADRVITIDPLTVSMFRGSGQGSVRFDFADQMSVDWKMTGSDLRLEDALSTTVTGEGSVSGRTSLDVDGHVDLRVGSESLRIEAHIDIVEGDLMDDPIFGGLMREAGRMFSDKEEVYRDSGSADLLFLGDHVAMTNVELIGDTSAARGEGEIGYDGTVDFRFNAGPLERLQSATGLFGKLFSVFTDLWVEYHVGGTFEKPTFAVRPLGIDIFGSSRKKTDSAREQE